MYLLSPCSLNVGGLLGCCVKPQYDGNFCVVLSIAVAHPKRRYPRTEDPNLRRLRPCLNGLEMSLLSSCSLNVGGVACVMCETLIMRKLLRRSFDSRLPPKKKISLDRGEQSASIETSLLGIGNVFVDLLLFERRWCRRWRF